MFSCLLSLLLAQIGAPQAPLSHTGTVHDKSLQELSGLVKATSEPTRFWAHGDSGNPASIFAIDAQGRIALRANIAAPNVDWEDIASDFQGRLFIGDIGNNGGFVPLRFIYEVDEPPLGKRGHDTQIVKPRKVHVTAFPDRPFDAESLFLLDDQLVIVRKRLDEREATLHAIPRKNASTLLNPVVWKQIATLEAFVEPATGADLSRDGRWLAVCSPVVARVYERTDAGWKLAAAHPYSPRSIEAIAWDGRDLVLADEAGNIYRWSSPIPASRRD